MTDKQAMNEHGMIEIADRAALAAVDGGTIWDPSCPGYPTDDPWFAPFGPPPIGPIILC